MQETPADLQLLHTLLDQSIEQAGPFLRSSFQMPEHSLSAVQLAARLHGSLTVALATVTARGEPRVAPITALFLRAAFYMPTVAEAARAKHLTRRPGASITYFDGTDLAVIAHGHAAIIGADHPDFDELDATQVEWGNQSVRDWSGHGIYLHLRPAKIYTFVRHPDGARTTPP